MSPLVLNKHPQVPAQHGMQHARKQKQMQSVPRLTQRARAGGCRVERNETTSSGPASDWGEANLRLRIKQDVARGFDCFGRIVEELFAESRGPGQHFGIGSSFQMRHSRADASNDRLVILNQFF